MFRNYLTDPKLVDLFSPEFCLKIGDKFIHTVRSTEGAKHTQLDSVTRLEDNEGNNFEDQLRNIVTELMDKELTQ